MRLRILFTALLLTVVARGLAQFGVGVRDNRYIYGDFTFARHLEVKLEHSVFSEKFGYQYVRGYFGYKNGWNDLTYKTQAYFGTTYNGSYYSAGALVKGRYTLVRRLLVDAALNPHYDSDYGYKTCFSAGLGCVITKNIDILAAYTTIPEYRMSEKRVRAGFDFHVKSLSVYPELSIAVDGSSKTKSLRALMGFRYQF